MSWKYVDDLLLKFSKNSTLIGKVWILSILLFRLLVLTAFGEHIWSDEQREFTCNTKQPGCENVCFNTFTPVSNIRLWGLQMLAVSVPGAFYFLYVLHVISRSKIITSPSIATKRDDKSAATRQRTKPSQEEPLKGAKKRWKLLSGHIIPPEINRSRVRCVWRLYFFQIMLRIAIECLFSLLQYEVYFYRWTVPEVFACSRWPCPHTVDCFISRPHEKTVFFRYMFAVSGLSVFLSLAELFHIFWTGLRHSCEAKQKSISENSRYLLAKPAKIQNIYLPVNDRFDDDSLGNVSQHKYKRKSGSKLSSSPESVFSSQENDENSDKDGNRVSYL